MCGIAGVVSLDGHVLEPGAAGRMRDQILHRGPDGAGEYDARGVSLAACRLAIVDLDPRGLQPMASADGNLHVVHNGEIYNRLELRDELVAGGVALRTTTDTEVLLHLWKLHGEQMLDRLDGMFAFAIWDAARSELFAARDRCGEKPFFYAVDRGALWFASEPKALFAGGVPCTFDERTWPELLAFRATAGARTPYVGVKRLLPGHWLRAGGAGIVSRRWWGYALEDGSKDMGSFGDLLEDSVRHRLIADVPVGVLLSGGLDSSSVTTIAAAQSDRRLPAFTVRYRGSRFDEGEYASAAAARADVEHHEIDVDPIDLPDLIADTAWHLDEPISFSAAPELLAVSRYASNHVRVLLTGESADELFGGYTRMRLYRYPRLARWAGRAVRPVERYLRAGSRWQRAATASRRSGAEMIALVSADGDPSVLTRASIEEWAPYRAEAAEQAVRDYRQPVLQALAYERHTHLPTVLALGDRLTMAAAIETRLPFTDHRLLALAGTATEAELFEGPHGKRPLRQYMAGRLPASVLNRRKRGWAAPFGTYLRQNARLRNWLRRAPDHPIAATSPYGAAGFRRFVDRFLDGDVHAAREAWIMGRVVLWHQRCVERNPHPFDGL